MRGTVDVSGGTWWYIIRVFVFDILALRVSEILGVIKGGWNVGVSSTRALVEHIIGFRDMDGFRVVGWFESWRAVFWSWVII